MKESPIGHPPIVPMGSEICGNPDSPAMQVMRMTRVRNDSCTSFGA